MANIIGGNGTGTLDSSLYLLNRNDTTGAGTAGHGEQVYINVANGNLVIDHLDQFLPSETNGFLSLRTYNSRGGIDTAAGDGWMLNEFSHLSVITAGEIVVLNGDGSQFTFKFDSSSGLYKSVDGAGAYETISFNARTGTYSLTQSNQTVLTYDLGGRLRQSRDTNGNTIDYDYDLFSRLSAISDDSGHRLSFIYELGNLTRIQDESGTVFARYEYFGDELVSATDRAGETTGYTYYLDGNLRSVTLPGTLGEPDRTLFFTYTAGPNGPLVSSFTDAQGNVTRFQYNFTVDIFGHVKGGTTRVTDAAGNVTAYSFDGQGNITNVHDANGRDTAYTYDSNQNLTSVTDANGVTTRLTYDKNGNIASRLDGLGNLTTYTYTGFNKIASTTSADGNALITSDEPLYVAKRQELGFVDPKTGQGKTVAQLTSADKQAILALYTTVYSYDSRQNLTQIQTAGSELTRLSYDSLGNLTQKTVFLDPANLTDPAKQQTTKYFYDAFGNNIKTIDAQGNTTLASFDHFGNRLTQVDGNGGVTRYTYDAENRLISTTDPLGNTTLSFYDAVGNRIAIQDAAGHTTTWLYDADNLLITVIDPAANPLQSNALTRTTRYTYDVMGNQTRTTDAEGRTTTYSYDALNRLVTITTPTVTDATGHPVAYTTTYGYDGVGNRITTIDNNGNRTDVVYNADNLVRSTTDASGRITQFAYDADLNQVSIVIGAELEATAREVLKFDYDPKDRLISSTDALGNTSHYAYDGANNRISATDANGHTTDFSYDKDNRLLTQTQPVVTDPVTGQQVRDTIQYQYDANGNQIAVTDQNGHTVFTTFDADNRVVLVKDANGIQTVFTYDSRGNRTSVQMGVQAHVNSFGRVIIEGTENAQIETYSYDEFNQVVAKTDAVGNALISSDSALYVQMRQQLGIVDSRTGQGKRVAQLTQADIRNLQAQFTEHYSYDRVGNYTSTTDHLGHTTTLTYDKLNRLIKTTDALGHQSTRAYDGNGNVVASTDVLGRTTRFSYDAVNRLGTSTDALGVVTQAAYDSFGNLISTTTASGTPDARTTRFVYDLDNRLVTRTDALGVSQTYTYDAVGNRLQVTDGKGQTTRYVYDALNRNIAIIDPLGLQTRMIYDGVGNKISLVDANGGITRFTYDAGNREISLQDALGRQTTFTYDVRGNRVTQTTAAGTSEQHTTTYLYDAQNNLRQVTDAAGNVATQGYDAVYNLTRTADANGNVTTYAYDALNRLIQVTDALGAVTRYAYDAASNRLSVTDANGHVTTFAYNARNEEIRSTDANGVDTTYAYDSLGNRVRITTAANTSAAATRTFAYDLDNRLISQTDALGNTETTQYDANGNVSVVTDALGHQTTYAHDADNRVQSITDALGNVTQYRYDANGNRVQVIDARGFTSTTYYDADNEVALAVDNDGFATRLSYDANGNILSRTLYATALTLPLDPAVQPSPVTSASDRTTHFTYDALNRIVSRTDGEGYVTQFVYDAVGNQIATRQALDLAATQFEVTRSYYDAVGRVIASVTAQGYLTTYQYDAAGNRVAQTRYDQAVVVPTNGSLPVPATGDTGRTTTFVHDADNRLVQQTDALGAVTTYQYDARGNRIAMTEAAGTADARTILYRYDAADRYIETTDPLGVVTHLNLDANGNVIARYQGYGMSQQRLTTYTYDANDRVVSQTDPLGVVTQTNYDASGNVASSTMAAGTGTAETTTFTYDGNDREVSTTDATGGVTTYAYDAAGNRVRVTQAAGLPEERTNVLVYDRANRLVSATDAVGTVTQYQYDGVGNKLLTLQAVGTAQQRRTSYVYDQDNRLVQVIDPMSGVTRYEYDAQGNQTRITDANGGVQVNTFDALGQVLTSLSAGGVLTRNTYDLRGNVVTTTQSFADGSDARTSTYAYDPLNRQIRVTDGEGFSTSIVYDSFGNQVSITHGQYLVSQSDPAYNRVKAAQAFPQTSTFTYDADNRMLTATDAVGEVISHQYDAVGNRTSLTDGNGHTTLYSYDLLNRLVQTTTPEGGITRYTYDHLGNPIAKDQLQSGDPATGIWAHTRSQYDANGRLVAQVDPTGAVTQYVYDAVGNLISQTSGAGTSDARTVRMEYDFDNRKVADVDALGNRTTYRYDALGNRIQVTDPLGHVAHYYYDGANQLTEVVDPQGFVNTFAYDAAGNRTQTRVYMTAVSGPMTDKTPPTPVGSSQDRITSQHYDRANRLISQTAPDGSVTQYAYDAAGNKVTETDFANTSAPRTQSFAYDADDRLVTFTDVDGTVTTFAYDKANNKTSQSIASAMDPNPLRTTSYTYDANNRELSETFDPSGLGIVQSFKYDHLGNVVSKTDGNGHQTTFTYDLDNRQVSQTDPLGNTQQFSYDRVGNKTAVTDARGNTTNYVYDAANRLIQEIKPPVQIYTVSGGFTTVRPTTTHVYDANGNEVQTTAADGTVTTRYFDGDNHKIAQVDATNVLTTFTVDAAGEVASQTLYMTRLSAGATDPAVLPQPPAGDSHQTTYAYDVMGRLTQVTYPPVKITTLVNANTQNPSAVTRTQQVTERYVYDAFGNVVESFDKNGHFALSYYDVKNRKIASVDAAGYLTQWDYDSQGNVLEQRVYTQTLDPATLSPSSAPTPPPGEVYVSDIQYDAASRKVKETAPQVSVFDPNTQTSSSVRSTTTYTYDRAGNQLTRTLGAGTAQAVTEYSYYDADNRRVAVIDSARVLSTYSYDANGNLVAQKRFINPVAAGVDLAQLSGSSNFASLVSASASGDEASDFTYDALNRQTSQTDLMGSGALTKTSAYDAVSNKTYARDEDGFVTQASYDGMGRLVESIGPDGSGTQYQYDAAGNQILIYTGVLTGGAPTPASNVAATLGSQVTLTWNTQGSSQHPVKTWVVYDTSSHQNIADYANRTGTVVSTQGTGQAVLNPAAPGATLFFRVVTEDGAGNETWTAEQSITAPPRFTAVSVAQPAAGTLVVTVSFDAGVVNPRLVYGASGNLGQSVAFVQQSNGSYQATLTGLTDPGALSFALHWQDAVGNSYSSSVGTFAAAADPVGVSSTLSQSQIVSGGNTAYTISVSTQVPAGFAAGLTGLQAQWRLAGSGSAFAETAVTGTRSGQGTEVFNAVLGDDNALAPGTYEIVLTGVRADGTSVELDHFTYVVSATSTSVTRQGVSWIAPGVGNDQLVIIDGQNAPSTRDGGRIVATDTSQASSTDYAAFYGQDVTDSHTVNVGSTARTQTSTDPNNPDGPPIVTITGYDVALQVTLTGAEAANIGSGGLHLAWRPAGSGTDFSNDVALSGSGNTFSTTLGNLPAGQYDLKLYYVDAQGHQVIVEWRRIDAATANNVYSGHSLTVLAQESGGTISTNPQGVLSIASGVYTGALSVAALSSSLALSLNATGSAGGSLLTDGRTTGYFTEIQYNALNQKIASNEGDGLWRQFGVDGNGNVVETDLLGDRANPNYNPANAITTYTAYDARNRKIAEFGAPVEAAAASGLERAVDRYAYNVLDKVVQHTDALGNTTQYVFNALGTQIEQIDSLGQTTQTLVDQFGNTTASITQLGHTTLNFYDLQHRLIKTQDAMGNVTSYTYDAFGRKLAQTDALGHQTSYSYDQRDRLVSQTDPLGHSATFAYDGRNNRISTLYPQGERTDQVYDSLGRVIDTEVFLNGQPTHVQSAYDAYGNLIAETDAMGRTKTHVYGAFSRLLEDIDEDGNVIAYSYDVYGRRTNAYDPNAVGDPTAATDPSGGKDIQTSYDQAGRVTSINDLATGVSTNYTYDLLGQRLSEVISTPGDIANRNMTYEYDALGQLVRWHDSVTGDNLNKQYDAEGNVAREYTDNGYDPLGQNSGANSNFRYVDHVYTYDADRRVTQEVQRATDASGNTSDAIINAYTYDAASNKITWNNAGVIVSYSYDADGRVMEGDYFSGSDSNQQKWTYDAMGNVLSFTVLKNGSQTSSTVNTYNDANRTLTTNKDDQITTNTYDLSLRLTQTVLQNKGKTFTYDHDYFGDGREKSVTAFGDAKGNSVSTYDVNKIQTRLDLGQADDQTRPEFKTFVADNEGHILYELHDDGKSDANETDQFLYANGNAVGQNTQGTDGKLIVQFDADSFAPIQNLSDSNPGLNLTYTVRDGDTLQSIASQMYGNASLWFVIADANGLGAGEALKAGTQLLIPNTIQSGTITANNHKVYSSTDIVGSTLPNLKSPPPPHHGGCASIVAIVVIVVIAVVAVIATAGLAGAIIAAAGAAAAASTAATVAAYAAAGIIVGALASATQQGIFIALDYQKDFSWKDVAAGAVAGGLAGAAAGVGQAAQLAAKAGELSSAGAQYAKVAEAALDVAKVASKQLIDNGQITSWTGLAAAAVGGYATAGEQIATGAANDLSATQQALNNATAAYQASNTLATVTNYVTPWVQLAETYVRNDKLAPADWASAVGSTLSQVVTTGRQDNTISQQLTNAGLRLGTAALVAGGLSRYDKQAAASYIENSVGQEVGSFIGGFAGGKLSSWLPQVNQGSIYYDSTLNTFIDGATGAPVSAQTSGPQTSDSSGLAAIDTTAAEAATATVGAVLDQKAAEAEQADITAHAELAAADVDEVQADSEQLKVLTRDGSTPAEQISADEQSLLGSPKDKIPGRQQSSWRQDGPGRIILLHYLWGEGRPLDIRDDPYWTDYLIGDGGDTDYTDYKDPPRSVSERFRDTLQNQVANIASNLVDQGKSGDSIPAATRFHAEIPNGEGVIGYNYLHGTNSKVGDFLIAGWANVTPTEGGTRVDFEGSFVWNDIIDPNKKYTTDIEKSNFAQKLANVMPTWPDPKPYDISIGFRATVSVFIPSNPALPRSIVAPLKPVEPEPFNFVQPGF